MAEAFDHTPSTLKLGQRGIRWVPLHRRKGTCGYVFPAQMSGPAALQKAYTLGVLNEIEATIRASTPPMNIFI
jgi:hypothetical protein